MCRSIKSVIHGWLALAAILSSSTVLSCAWLALIPTGKANAAQEIQNAEASFDARYLEARMLLVSGKNEEARKVLEPCAADPACPDYIYKLLAQAWLAVNNSDKAMGVVEQGLKRSPESVELLMLRASVQREKGRITEAIADLQTALKFAPNRQDILEMLSELHLMRLVSNPADSDAEVKELISVYNRMLGARKGNDRLVPLLVLSTLYLKTSEPVKAMEVSGEAYKLRSDSPRVMEAYATALVAGGKIEEAIEIYKKAVIASPDDDEIRRKVEALLLKQGGEERRLRFFAELAEANKDNPAVLQMCSQALMAAKKWPEAEKVLRALLERKPDDVPNKLALLHVWIAQGRIDEALSEAKKMGKTNGDLDPAIALAMAESFESGGHRAKALELLQDFTESHPMNENVALGLASLLLEDKQKDKARSVLEKVRAQSPDSFMATTLLAQMYADDDKYADAHAVLAGLPAEVKAKHTLAVDLLRGGLYVNEGVQREQQSRHSEAEKLYQKALDLLDKIPAPDNDGDRQRMLDLRVSIWLNRGLVLQKQGKWEEAEKTYQKGIELDPANAEAYNTLGYFYAESNRKLDEGRKMIQKALELKPNAAHIIDSLGWLLYREGKVDEAVAQLQKAANGMPPGEPESAEVYDHLGDALKAAGRMDEARVAWQKAIDLKPKDLDIAAVKKKLEVATK